jgi:hypothetical protein
MKNTTCVKQIYYCTVCYLHGFFITTPHGGDYYTCPCCSKYDLLHSHTDGSNDDVTYDFLFEDEYDNDMRNLYHYCNTCNIIFETGCLHHNGGCTDNTFNAHFIKKWKDKRTNEEYDGMPLFDGEDDWFNNVNHIEVLEMYCPHKGQICEKNHHPISYKCKL